MSGWRDAVASALDEQAAVLVGVLVELDNAHAVLEARGNTDLCGELRALAAGLRSEASDMTSEARTLRARPRDDGRGFPLAITTRHVRKELES